MFLFKLRNICQHFHVCFPGPTLPQATAAFLVVFNSQSTSSKLNMPRKTLFLPPCVLKSHPLRLCPIVLPRRLNSTFSPSPSTPKTWVSRLPVKVQPYVSISRIDKPIGTLLLLYPCSNTSLINLIAVYYLISHPSLVNNYGFVCLAPPTVCSNQIYYPLWSGCIHNA